MEYINCQFALHIGQFWNVPVTASGPITSPPDGIDVGYNVTVEYPGVPARTFIGDLYHRIWDRTLKPCLYAGNSQGGPIYEGNFASDSVIEGEYFEYKVTDGIFGANFRYNRLEVRPCPRA